MINWFRTIKAPGIQFLCHKDDYGVIPEPYPARKLLPEWYKKLPQKIDNVNKLENSTIKRCAPVLDAFCIGWIIPLAADVEFTTNDDASGVTWKSIFYRTMVESHSAPQINAPGHSHDQDPKPPLKFINWWQIKVDPGYSVLFVPPLNRPDPRFECMSGIVDEGYSAFVNFPFFFNQPKYTGIIKQGTPLVQAIVIKKEPLIAEARALTDEELKDIELTARKRKAHESLYRDSIWRPTK